MPAFSLKDFAALLRTINHASSLWQADSNLGAPLPLFILQFLLFDLLRLAILNPVLFLGSCFPD
jgi:hypothetical protein